jgi:hypothetical protein
MDIQPVRDPGKRRIAGVAVATAAALSACLMTAVASSQQSAAASGAVLLADNTPNPFQQLINKANPAQTPPIPSMPGSTGPIPPIPGSTGANAPAVSNGPASAPKLASQEQARQLFLKGTVTGEDLKEELEAVKGAAANPKARSELAAVVGQASAQIASAKTHNFLTDLGGRMKELAGDLLRQKATSYSDKVLMDFLTTLTGDDEALRKETITLPSATASKMTLNQQQSVLLMAALVVGTRIAHHVLDAAHKDFIGLETEYAALLSKRQEQAALMADVLDKRRQAKAAKDELTIRHMDADLGKWLSPEDLKFIDSFGPDTSLREFANDLGMQNLAIKFLQHRDPTAYAEYRAQRSGVMGRSRAYLRTTSGVAAFGGFSMAFMQEIVKTAHDKNMYEIFAALPLAGEYIKEAGPLIKLSSDALYTGLVAEPASLKHHYRLVQREKTVDVNDADAVFGALDRSKEAAYFADALFRNETPGFIYHVYLCDPSEAGALIDQTLKQENRRSFAEQYLQMTDGAGFSFADALNDDVRTPTAQKLAEPLLSKDQRVSGDVVAIGEIQKLTATEYTKWKTSALTRLILANSQGVYAQMQLGDTVVRLVPSMATIYAYESYADSCGQTAKRETEGSASTKATKGSAKPKKQMPKPKPGNQS